MKADYVLDYDVLVNARDYRLYLLARIKAKPAPPSGHPPLNISVVLDRSGSMAGDKLAYVKNAAQLLVQHLKANDRFSLVTYDQEIETIIPPGTVSHRDEIKRIIQGIEYGWGTNLSGGWLRGCQHVSEGMTEKAADSKRGRAVIPLLPSRGAKAEGQINRVLLLTDGLANLGVTSPNRLAAMARQKREEGITTTTMGVGLDFNEDLLLRMASQGGGAFYFIDNADQAPHVFAEELGDMQTVVGQNLIITLTPSPGVRFVRQLNAYPRDDRDHNITFRLGDLHSDETKQLVLELEVPGLEESGDVELARLRFDYDELGEDGVTHQMIEVPIVVNAVPEDDFEEQDPHADVVKATLLLRAARAREEAIRHADRSSFRQAADTLTEIADAILEANLNDDELQTEHDMLREDAVDLELRYDARVRKTETATTQLGERPERRGNTQRLRGRLKASRGAMERHGETPAVIRWKRDTLELDVGLLRIGRAADNDIVIPDNNVSRYHCQIVRDGDSLFLIDLNSTNGTYANGGLVESRFRLSVGDVMSAGPWLFWFR
jgi:Ca-activated chloride channel family protein